MVCNSIGKWLDCYYFPYAKNIVGTLFRDVTGRKNLEKELQDKERLAAIGATAGMVGHDIRNPLQAIVNDTYFAKKDLDSLPESEQKISLKESLNEIEGNTDYINKIVQDLQDFARPLTPTAREIDLESLCEEVLFKNGVPDNVKASSQVERKVKRVFTDPDLLKRILTNLVSNAVQAMPNGGKLAVHAYLEANEIVITVSDTGVGIPDAVRPKLFVPLMTTKSKGQGFGLAVVKRITETLGGTVTFESEVGKGTKFTVRLPPKK
jgi:signal transduction histidine kinase